MNDEQTPRSPVEKQSGCANKGCLIGSLAALAVLAAGGFMLLLLIGLIIIGANKLSELDTGDSPATFRYASGRNFKEIYVEGSNSVSCPNKIVVINVNGVIVSDEGSSYYDSAVSGYIRAQLRKAANDFSVKAVIMNLNTPGGEVTASDEI